MKLLALYQTYKPALVRVTVQTDAGDLSTGTAFHIGDGWLVTAAHVLKDCVIQEVVSERYGQVLRVESTIFNKDDRIDLALMKTDLDLSQYLEMTTFRGAPEGFVQTDHIEIGGHLDDWLGDELLLSKVLLMGYPPIPFSRDAVLLPSEGEVNAIVDKYSGPHPHIIISCPARGGFSGGPVISEYGFLLGVLTESLVVNNKDAETGYSSAISVEPLLTMLHENRIYPGNNRAVIAANQPRGEDGTKETTLREQPSSAPPTRPESRDLAPLPVSSRPGGLLPGIDPSSNQSMTGAADGDASDPARG